jgi:hypothetical protein
VGAESRSRLIGLVVKVVCLGRPPLVWGEGVGVLFVEFSYGCLGLCIVVDCRFFRWEWLVSFLRVPMWTCK